ncbi:Dna polymerase i a protein [Thalictrum thalictroides]|uniref:DNA-directed DNA polymerase n=1 Tax=Thalictrum thalictroides TaxID=46969 RepID=A0A7J6X5Q9_THATH|nr:Dna polymerase i a protein [Thalictrum thalictroides]
MVVTTPSGQFKTSCPSSFFFSSQPRRLFRAKMASSSSPCASLSRNFSSRRNLHFHPSRNDPSISTTNISSSNLFRRPVSIEDPLPVICKRVRGYLWVHCLASVASVNQSNPTSSLPPLLIYNPDNFDYEDRKNTSTNPEHSLDLWRQESKRLNQNKLDENEKRRQLELKTSHGTEDSNKNSKGSPDGSYYVGQSFSGSSTCSPKLDTVEVNGQSRPICQPEVQNGRSGELISVNGRVNHKWKINSPLKENSNKDVHFNGSNRQHLETAEGNSASKGGAKFDGTQKPKAISTGHHKNLSRIYDEVVVVNNISDAQKVVGLLTTEYRDLVHACDTEVASIDVKKETPVNHGEIICFSIYSGETADYGNGKSCIWVDVLDGGGRELLMEFAPFFEDSSIKKVWHNYSFDSHVIENYGIKISGFHADTMHMARLWDSARRTEGGYSLEALTSDSRVMNEAQSCRNRELIGKISMKTIFGKKKLKRDGSEGKLTIIPPVEELQREEPILWTCYSALDSMSTLQLFESLQKKLEKMEWISNGKLEGSMFKFYEKYWRPFGELLVKLETEGMLVNCAYLAEIQKVATREQQIAADRFRKWAARYCPDAMHMNVGSDAQLRQLFFGGTLNSNDPNEALPLSRSFKVPNTDNVIEEGKKDPSKFRNITLCSLGVTMETEIYTASGWPSVSGDALKTLAGKVSSEYDWTDDEDISTDQKIKKEVDDSYGTAYEAFGREKEGKEACHAIAALCEVCSIDSLLSNFILPLQSNNISGKNGRIHCSLNINTETGRLSARRPNLQNQPALEKDRYKIRQAFIAAPGNSLIVADYGQLELRILAHLANCRSMKDAFKAGGDFHSRTAMNMYSHIREAVEKQEVLLEWHPQSSDDKSPVPLLKDAFGSERRKAKMLNFSIAYGKTPVGLARDWKVSVKEAKATVNLWYSDRKEVLYWQKERKEEANTIGSVKTLLGRTRSFPSLRGASNSHKGHIERAAINTPVQGSAADVAMCAMLEISKNARLRELGWKLLLQVHDEVILEGPAESAEVAKAIVVECMSKPFDGTNILSVDLAVDAKCAQNWYAAK